MNRPLLAAVALFAAGLLPARAHAFLDHAEPGVGREVAVSPAVVKLWFTRHIKTTESTVQIYNAAKEEVDCHDTKVDPGDPTLLLVSLPKLPPGTYQVVWKAVCFDTHTTHGNFTFTISSASGAPSR